MSLFIYHFIVIKSSIWCGLFSCMVFCFYGNRDFSTIHSLKCLHSISWLTHAPKIAFCKLTCSGTHKEMAAKKPILFSIFLKFVLFLWFFFLICFPPRATWFGPLGKADFTTKFSKPYHFCSWIAIYSF